MTLSITDTQHNIDLHYAEYHLLFIVMLSVFMLSIILLNIVKLNAVMLSVMAPSPGHILLLFEKTERQISKRMILLYLCLLLSEKHAISHFHCRRFIGLITQHPRVGNFEAQC
jgi:hypothetical protein